MLACAGVIADPLIWEASIGNVTPFTTSVLAPTRRSSLVVTRTCWPASVNIFSSSRAYLFGLDVDRWLIPLVFDVGELLIPRLVDDGALCFEILDEMIYRVLLLSSVRAVLDGFLQCGRADGD